MSIFGKNALERMSHLIRKVDPHTVSRALIGFVLIGCITIGATFAFVVPSSASELHHVLVRAARALR